MSLSDNLNQMKREWNLKGGLFLFSRIQFGVTQDEI